MGLRLFHCLLLACATVAMVTNDDATRSERDLQFIKDIILSKFSGNMATQVPATSSPEYKFVNVPGFRKVLVKTSKVPINLVEIKIPCSSDSESEISIPTIAIVEYMGTKAKNITSTPVKGVNDLLFGALHYKNSVDDAVSKVPYSTHVNYMPESVPVVEEIESKGYHGFTDFNGSYDYRVPIKGTIKLQNPYELFNSASKSAFPKQPDINHNLNGISHGPVNEVKNIEPIKVSQAVPVSPIHTKYSYKQFKNDGSLISYIANDNSPISVTKTSKFLPPSSPLRHAMDRIPQIPTDIPLDVKSLPVGPVSAVPQAAIVDIPASIANSFTTVFESSGKVTKNLSRPYFENNFSYKQIHPAIAYFQPNAVKHNRQEGSSVTLSENNKAKSVPNSIISNSDENIAAFSTSAEIPNGPLGPYKLVNGKWYVNNDHQAYLPQNDVVLDYNPAFTAHKPIPYDRPAFYGVIDDYPIAVSGNNIWCPYVNSILCQNFYHTPANLKISRDNFHTVNTVNRLYNEETNQEKVYVAPITRYSYKHKTNKGEYVNKDGVAQFKSKVSEPSKLKETVVKEVINKTRDEKANDSLQTNPIIVLDEQVYTNKQNITADSSVGNGENIKNIAAKTNEIKIQASKEGQRGDIPDTIF